MNIGGANGGGFTNSEDKERREGLDPAKRADFMIYGEPAYVTPGEAIAWAMANCPMPIPDKRRLPWINSHRAKRGLPAFCIVQKADAGQAKYG